MEFFESILAHLAPLSAQTGAGQASTWNAYRSKEPKGSEAGNNKDENPRCQNLHLEENSHERNTKNI